MENLIKIDHDLIEYLLSALDTPDKTSANESKADLPQLGPSCHQVAYEIKKFMDQMPGGFFIYHADEAEEILYANKALLRIFNCDTMEEFQALTGNSFRGIVHPEDLNEVEKSIWEQISRSQHDLDYVEYRIVTKNGNVRWVEDYGHFVHSDLIGDLFYVFMADTTNKRQFQIEERNALLKEKLLKERLLQTQIDEYDKELKVIHQEHLRRLEVIEGLSVNYESIFYLDMEDERIRPYRISGRTEAIFSAREAMPYGDYLASYIGRWVHEEDRERVAGELSPENVRRKLSGDLTFYINYRVVERGVVEYLQIRFVNVGRKDRASQVVLGCRRVDEELRREMEQKQTLEEALYNANSSIMAKNTFLSNMSHDMRTPLNAIFGFTALARHHLDSPEAIAGYLDRIESSSRQLLDMIDKVLKLSWIDSNEARAEETPFSLWEALNEVYAFLQPQAEEKGLDFTLDCSQVTHDQVLGDREKLGQLVMYLVNNAVTYTSSGGSVQLAAIEDETLPNHCAVYRLAVRDTGIGISEEFIQQIFEPFTRERNTTLSGVHGVGLGLAIAKDLAELLGGSIEVDSAVGEGSTFTVTLRLRLQEDGPAQVHHGAGDGSSRRILLAEDNELNREIAESILEEAGFSVESVEDGAAALEAVRSAPAGTYDLVVMDIQMPVMNGWQAAEAIRALPDPALARIPIVALSANVFDSDIQRSMDAGMEAHLAKPIDVPVLLGTIRGLLR